MISRVNLARRLTQLRTNVGRVAVESPGRVAHAWRGTPQPEWTCQQRPVLTIGISPSEDEAACLGLVRVQHLTYRKDGGRAPTVRPPRGRQFHPGHAWPGCRVKWQFERAFGVYGRNNDEAVIAFDNGRLRGSACLAPQRHGHPCRTILH